jgi:hypothetical protein
LHYCRKPFDNFGGASFCTAIDYFAVNSTFCGLTIELDLFAESGLFYFRMNDSKGRRIRFSRRVFFIKTFAACYIISITKFAGIFLDEDD